MDSKVYGPLDTRIQPYTTIKLIGPSNSGKTFLSCEIALKRDKIFKKPHEKVIYFYRYYQDTFEITAEADDSILFINNKEEVEQELEDGVPTLLVADDFLGEATTTHKKYVTEFFTQRCHHDKITLLFQSQVLYPEKGRTWALNCSHYVLLRNPHRGQMDTFFRNINPEEKEFLLDAYHHSTDREPYKHFFMSLYPGTPDHLRYRSSIISETGVEFFIPR